VPLRFHCTVCARFKGKRICSCSCDHCCPRWGARPGPTSSSAGLLPAAALTTPNPSPGTAPPVCRAAERPSPLGPPAQPQPPRRTPRRNARRGPPVPSVSCPHAPPPPPPGISFRRDSRRPLVAGARAAATATTAFPLPNSSSPPATFLVPVLLATSPPLPSAALCTPLPPCGVCFTCCCRPSAVGSLQSPPRPARLSLPRDGERTRVQARLAAPWSASHGRPHRRQPGACLTGRFPSLRSSIQPHK